MHFLPLVSAAQPVTLARHSIARRHLALSHVASKISSSRTLGGAKVLASGWLTFFLIVTASSSSLEYVYDTLPVACARVTSCNDTGAFVSWLLNYTVSTRASPHNTTQHNTTQHNTTQHNTTQHCDQ